MADIFNMADTWNDGATTFTAIKMNVTDTASAAGSLLMDLQVGGSSKAHFTKGGLLGIAAINDGTNFFYEITSGSKVGLGYFNSGITIGPNGSPGLYVKSGGPTIPVTSTLSWSSAGWSSAADVILARDAANTLAQRNGVNPQAFRLYNTYTDASNYERVAFGWSSNTFMIDIAKAGTGSYRQFRINAYGTSALAIADGSGFNKLQVADVGAFSWSTNGNAGDGSDLMLYRVASGIAGVRGANKTTGGALNLLEQTAPSAPSADQVTIYAEDNGSGKTRLMALFATGAAQQIAIEP